MFYYYHLFYIVYVYLQILYFIYLIDWLEEELKRVDEPVDDLLDFLFDLYPTGFYQTKVSDLIKYCMNK